MTIIINLVGLILYAANSCMVLKHVSANLRGNKLPKSLNNFNWMVPANILWRPFEWYKKSNNLKPCPRKYLIYLLFLWTISIGVNDLRSSLQVSYSLFFFFRFVWQDKRCSTFHTWTTSHNTQLYISYVAAVSTFNGFRLFLIL